MFEILDTQPVININFETGAKGDPGDATPEFIAMVSQASADATTATTQAGIATTQAGIAATKAGEASTSATNAATSESNALSYKNDTSALVNGFDTKVSTSKTEIETLTTTKKGEVTSLATEKKTEITTEGARVLGTIPADYTSTTKDVANLKALGLYIDSDGDISQL